MKAQCRWCRQSYDPAVDHERDCSDALPGVLPYQLGVTNPARRLERAAKAVADAAPDCRGVQAVGQVSVPVALMAAQQEALWGKKR